MKTGETGSYAPCGCVLVVTEAGKVQPRHAGECAAEDGIVRACVEIRACLDRLENERREELRCEKAGDTGGMSRARRAQETAADEAQHWLASGAMVGVWSGLT